jgi:hypothetical protein
MSGRGPRGGEGGRVGGGGGGGGQRRGDGCCSCCRSSCSCRRGRRCCCRRRRRCCHRHCCCCLAGRALPLLLVVLLPAADVVGGRGRGGCGRAGGSGGRAAREQRRQAAGGDGGRRRPGLLLLLELLLGGTGLGAGARRVVQGARAEHGHVAIPAADARRLPRAGRIEPARRARRRRRRCGRGCGLFPARGGGLFLFSFRAEKGGGGCWADALAEKKTENEFSGAVPRRGRAATQRRGVIFGKGGRGRAEAQAGRRESSSSDGFPRGRRAEAGRRQRRGAYSWKRGALAGGGASRTKRELSCGAVRLFSEEKKERRRFKPCFESEFVFENARAVGRGAARWAGAVVARVLMPSREGERAGGGAGGRAGEMGQREEAMGGSSAKDLVLSSPAPRVQIRAHLVLGARVDGGSDADVPYVTERPVVGGWF